MTISMIRGFDGTVQQGASNTDLVAIESWEADVDLEVETKGPFLNDSGNKYKVRGGKDCKFTIKGTVPSGKDTNQTALRDALLNGTDINVIMKQGAGSTGYGITVPTAIITNVKLGQDSKSGASIEIKGEANGSFSIS